MIIEPTRYLSMPEIAARTGLAESTVRTYRARGKLPAPAVMVGMAGGWTVDVIDAWAKKLPGQGARTDLMRNGKDL
jgi:predicted DNA-binding transcriptional regulator AlpA